VLTRNSREKIEALGGGPRWPPGHFTLVEKMPLMREFDQFHNGSCDLL
jgi:hypothetical protein